MKAVIIGINYLGTSKELKGCINDALATYAYLLENYPITKKDVRLMTDETVEKPTMRNIKSALVWLSKESTDNSSLFFSYAGHGSQERDSSSEEEDGKDERIIALDGSINDDEIQTYLFSGLKPGARLFCLFDCCHSGTMLDLDRLNFITFVSEDGVKGCFGCTKKKKIKKKGRDVICFGGCTDKGKSYETTVREEKKSVRRGVFSYYFLNFLKNNELTYTELIDLLQSTLSKRKSAQSPQLAYSGEVDESDIVKLL